MSYPDFHLSPDDDVHQFVVVEGLGYERVHAGREGFTDAFVVVVGTHAQDEQGLLVRFEMGLLEGTVPADALEAVHDGHLYGGRRQVIAQVRLEENKGHGRNRNKNTSLNCTVDQWYCASPSLRWVSSIVPVNR